MFLKNVLAEISQKFFFFFFWGFSWQTVRTGAEQVQQAITWANDDPVHCCIYESPPGLHNMHFYVHDGLSRKMLLQNKLEIWKVWGWHVVPLNVLVSYWYLTGLFWEIIEIYICPMKYLWNILLNIFSCNQAVGGGRGVSRWWPPSAMWAGPLIYLWPPPGMSE